jgi:probable rRNA maturation factor
MVMDDTKLEPDSPDNSENLATVWQSAAGNVIELIYDEFYWSSQMLDSFAPVSTRLLDHMDQQFVGDGIRLGLLLCGDAHIQDLNNRFRGQDKPTNVLSFPEPEDTVSRPPLETEKGDSGPVFFGEIAIAQQTSLGESVAMGIGFDDHLAHLFVHGVMHLLGYDHENDDDAHEMETHETAILAAFSIADPYAGSDPAARQGVIS